MSKKSILQPRSIQKFGTKTRTFQSCCSNKSTEEISGIPDCKTCQFGKQARLRFKKATWRATEKLQLIHTDMAGPHKTLLLKGSNYYIVFIDDYTRMCWIYFLRFKSEASGIFWKFKQWIETQSSYKIQALRSDNGNEYTTDQFNLFCEEAGIEHQLIAPILHNRMELVRGTIMEITRCLLYEKSLPKEYWAEAAHTALFLLNRLPTKAERKTQFEVTCLDAYALLMCHKPKEISWIKRWKLESL